MTRTYTVETYGCQMNVHDSERIAGLLDEAGYIPVTVGEQADIVVFNTCAVRENADNKLYGNLSFLAPIKKLNPNMQIAVGGCLAQKDQATIIKKAPYVDVVFGTHNVGSLPVLLERARIEEESQIEILESALKAAISRAISQGELSGTTPESITLERPKNREHGDYATSIALQLAKVAGKTPREVAQIILDQLKGVDSISALDIAGPGFINITLHRASQAELVATIIKTGKEFGHGSALTGVRINLEFISANPTGPLHVGHGRGLIFGKTLSNILRIQGHNVFTEYYVNNIALFL